MTRARNTTLIPYVYQLLVLLLRLSVAGDQEAGQNRTLVDRPRLPASKAVGLCIDGQKIPVHDQIPLQKLPKALCPGADRRCAMRPGLKSFCQAYKSSGPWPMSFRNRGVEHTPVQDLWRARKALFCLKAIMLAVHAPAPAMISLPHYILQFFQVNTWSVCHRRLGDVAPGPPTPYRSTA